MARAALFRQILRRDARVRAVQRDEAHARLAGIGDLTGSIEADKQADLIVCSGNPLQNLSALRELDMVVKGGYRIDKPQIKNG